MAGDLRDRIVRLWDLVSLPALTPEQRGDIADAFIHVIHQPEADRLRAELSSAEETATDREQNALHWQERAEEAEAAVARVRRLCDLTIAASVRVEARHQAVDTLAVLDQPKEGNHA